MAAELASMALNTVIDLFRASAFSALPVFLLALVLNALRRWLAKTRGWTWIKSAFIATLIVFALLVNLVYWPDWLSTIGKATYGEIPPEFRYTLPEIVFGYVINLARLLFVALLLSLLALPAEMVALYCKEHCEKKFGLKGLFAAFAGVFAALFLAWAVVLLLFPWSVAGVLYLIFFGFGP